MTGDKKAFPVAYSPLSFPKTCANLRLIHVSCLRAGEPASNLKHIFGLCDWLILKVTSKLVILKHEVEKMEEETM